MVSVGISVMPCSFMSSAFLPVKRTPFGMRVTLIEQLPVISGGQVIFKKELVTVTSYFAKKAT